MGRSESYQKRSGSRQCTEPEPSQTPSRAADGSGPPAAPARGLHGHPLPISNMLRAGLAEAVGTFFLIYTGTQGRHGPR